MYDDDEDDEEEHGEGAKLEAVNSEESETRVENGSETGGASQPDGYIDDKALKGNTKPKDVTAELVSQAAFVLGCAALTPCRTPCYPTKSSIPMPNPAPSG